MVATGPDIPTDTIGLAHVQQRSTRLDIRCSELGAALPTIRRQGRATRVIGAALASLAATVCARLVGIDVVWWNTGGAIGRLTGISGNANHLAYILSLAGLILMPRRRQQLWTAKTALLLAISLPLIWTGSRTAILGLVAATVVLAVSRRRRTRQWASALTAIVIGVAYVLAIANPLEFNLGRGSLSIDPGFTGRRALIAAAVDEMTISGFGYEGAHTAVQVGEPESVPTAPHSHNALLQAVLFIGTLPSVVFGTVLLLAIFNTRQRCSQPEYLIFAFTLRGRADRGCLLGASTG